MNALPPILPRISDYVSWHAARRPHDIAMTLGSSRISYADMERRVETLARALVAIGVRKGDRVATLQTPHPDYLTSFLATASIGAIWLGLNPRYRSDELRRAAADARPSVLLTRTSISGRHYSEEIDAITAATGGPCTTVVFDGDPLIPRALSMSEFLTMGARAQPHALTEARQACGGRDPCLIVYTSGSSGTPKGALLHHEGIAVVSRTQNLFWPVEPFSIVNYFPINHVGCVVDCSTPCLLAGGTLHFLEEFDARGCLELMVRERVTIWGSVPSVFQLQTQLEEFGSYDLSALQLIAWGGAAMARPLIERLAGVCSRLGTNYGMTETTGTITTLAPTSDLEALESSVGEPPPGIEVRLVQADGSPADHGVEGELQVRSGSNFLGYWQRPEATEAAFTRDGFFRTGDLALRRPDGRYKLVGRLSDMYKSGGYNVYPREVEQVLESHPAVALAAVVALPDPLWQEVGVACLTLRAPVAAAELEAHCRDRLANYKVPKKILILAELPLLPIGKVDKKALRAQALQQIAH